MKGPWMKQEEVKWRGENCSR